jgi:hypothetical protein
MCPLNSGSAQISPQGVWEQCLHTTSLWNPPVLRFGYKMSPPNVEGEVWSEEVGHWEQPLPLCVCMCVCVCVCVLPGYRGVSRFSPPCSSTMLFLRCHGPKSGRISKLWTETSEIISFNKSFHLIRYARCFVTMMKRWLAYPTKYFCYLCTILASLGAKRSVNCLSTACGLALANV